MPRKGENIYKRKDGRWEGRFILTRLPDGKAKYKSIYGKTYREVKSKLQEQKYLIESNQKADPIPQSSKYLSDILSEWLDMAAPKLKESSYVKYRNQIDLHIQPMIGHFTLGEITTAIIQDFVNSLLTSGSPERRRLSPKSVSDILSILKRVFQYASARYSAVNCDISQITLRQSASQMTVLTKQEQELLSFFLLSNVSNVHAGILLTLYTGLRIGELCALQWNYISLDEHLIFITQSMQRLQNKISGSEQKTRILISTPKSSCSVRTIPLPDFLVSYLRQFYKEGNSYLLTGKQEHFVEPRALQYQFKKVLKKAGIRNINFHSLRHTFATRCIESGFDIKSLSEILGHASVNITLNRYVHPSMELKKANMEKLFPLFPVK